MQFDRRTHPRVPIPLLIEYRVLQDPRIEGTSLTRDVSLSGLRLEFPTQTPPGLGSRLIMAIPVPPPNAPVRAEGQVVWLRPIARIGATQFEVGVKMNGMSAPDRTRLAAFIHEQLSRDAQPTS